MKSVAEHHPDADRACVLLARDTRQADSLREEFTAIPVASLGLPGGDDFLFRYDIPELATVAQPWIFEHVFSRGHDTVLFLAPGIRIFRPLVEVFRLLDTTADVVLTPQLVAPPSGTGHPDAVDALRAGTYSPDFLAVRRTGDTCRFIERWRDGLHRGGDLPLADGLAVDRRWRELLPACCERTAILRHRGYNVTPWNLAERRVHVGRDGLLLVDDEQLAFFNFSGLDPDDSARSAASQTPRIANEAVVRLWREQARILRDLGSAWYAGQPYDFGIFSDGGRVTPAERGLFRRDGTLRRACAGRPFSHPELVRLASHVAAGEPALATSFSAFGEHWRLQAMSEQLLGRPAAPAEIRAWQPLLGTRLGMARLLLTVGLSREARLTPGWLARLLHAIADWPMAAGPLRACRDAAVLPLTRLLPHAARLLPGLGYRPCPRHEAAVGSAPAPKQPPRELAASPPPGTPGPDAPGVNVLGYFGRELGIGEAARSLAGSCEAADIPVTRIDVGELFEGSPIAADSSQRRHHAIDVLCYNADIALAAARHLRAVGHRSGYRVGLWHWEQPVLPQRFHDAFAEVDELWVPSTFIQEAVGPVAPVPVVRIPHAVRFAPTPGVRRAAFGLPEDKRLVLVMYDFHSFQERKNPRAAVAAFRLAKAAEPSLGLVVKTINAQHHHRERQELEEALRDLTDVTFIDAALTRQQAWDLEMCCDILLSLHRAEGFGLILAEMMYLGKSVVATGWSANMDFMDESNSVPVAFELRPLPRPIGPYEAGIPWAEPDVAHAAAALRRLVTDPDLAARLGHNARETIRQKLDPQVVGARIRERLDVVRRWFPRARAAPPR